MRSGAGRPQRLGERGEAAFSSGWQWEVSASASVKGCWKGAKGRGPAGIPTPAFRTRARLQEALPGCTRHGSHPLSPTGKLCRGWCFCWEDPRTGSALPVGSPARRRGRPPWSQSPAAASAPVPGCCLVASHPDPYWTPTSLGPAAPPGPTGTPIPKPVFPAPSMFLGE